MFTFLFLIHTIVDKNSVIHVMDSSLWGDFSSWKSDASSPSRPDILMVNQKFTFARLVATFEL